MLQTPDVLPRALSLRVNFAWTFVGNLVYSGCQWGVLIAIARTSTVASVGQYALGLAVTAPVMILANQGLRELQATDAKRQFTFRHYVGYRLVSAMVALFLIALFSRGFGYPKVVLIVGIAKALESISDVLYGHYQRHDRMDCAATSMILRGAFSVGFVVFLMVATHSIQWAAGGVVLSNALVLALYDFRHPVLHAEWQRPASGSATFRSGRYPILSLMSLALPLGVAQMFNSTAGNIPRYVLERYEGPASLGVYAAIMYLIVVGRLVIAALAQSCLARLAKFYVQADAAAFTALLLKQLMVGLCTGVVGLVVSLLWGAPLLRIIYGSEYGNHTDILIIAMILAGINYLAEFTGSALTAVRAIKVQPIILGLCAATACLFSILLIPSFGIRGAALAALLTGSVQLLVYAVALASTCVRRNWCKA